jgi:uncharacterized protein YuzE
VRFSIKHLYVRRESDKLIVAFQPLTEVKTRLVDVGLVLDFNEYGDVNGIEIISIKHYGGPNLFEGCEHAPINSRVGTRFSYDEEEDAFSLELEEGSSPNQKAVDGKLVLDPEGRLVGLEAELN